MICFTANGTLKLLTCTLGFFFIWCGCLLSTTCSADQGCLFPIQELYFQVFPDVSLVISLVSYRWLKSVPALISMPGMLLTLFIPKKARKKDVFCIRYYRNCLPLCGKILVSMAIIPLRCIFNLVIYLIKLHGFRGVIHLSSLIPFSDKLRAKFCFNSPFWCIDSHLKDASVSGLNPFALYILQDVPIPKTSLQHHFFISLYVIAT